MKKVLFLMAMLVFSGKIFAENGYCYTALIAQYGPVRCLVYTEDFLGNKHPKIAYGEYADEDPGSSCFCRSPLGREAGLLNPTQDQYQNWLQNR